MSKEFFKNLFPLLLKGNSSETLLKKLEELGVVDISEEAEALPMVQHHRSAFADGYGWWGFGGRYREALDLSKAQVDFLNQFNEPANRFFHLQQCAQETVRLFFSLIEELDRREQKEGEEPGIAAIMKRSFSKEVDTVCDTIAKKDYRFRRGSRNYNACIADWRKKIYHNVLKHCENAVREAYDFKAKLGIKTEFQSADARFFYDHLITKKVEAALPGLLHHITPIEECTDIALYNASSTRWKLPYERLCASYAEAAAGVFVNGVVHIAHLNQENGQYRTVFLTAAKFIGAAQKPICLLLYFYYLNADADCHKPDVKALPKALMKELFDHPDYLKNFEEVKDAFLLSRDFEQAIKDINTIFHIKRKKIMLDKSSIAKVKEQHAGTVEILNEYLKDEEEQKTPNPPVETIKAAKISKAKEGEAAQVIVKEEISNHPLGLSLLQVQALQLFASKGFLVSEQEMDSFAKTQSVFKNQLLESINDACFEELDDLLIEEDADGFSMNESYYQTIIKDVK